MKIIITGNPIAKTRPKFARRGSFTHVYDSQEKKKEKIKIQMLSLIKKINPVESSIIFCAKYLKIYFDFFLPIPKTDSKKNKMEKLWQIQLPGIKPDIDNLEKFYLDCATGIFCKDDRVVVEVHSKKKYGQRPRVEIHIEEKKGFTMLKRSAEILTFFTPEDLDCFLYDAYNLGIFYKEDVFYPKDGEMKRELLERISEAISVFILNHGDKIKKISKKT